jgi:hypothetical protein
MDTCEAVYDDVAVGGHGAMPPFVMPMSGGAIQPQIAQVKNWENTPW